MSCSQFAVTLRCGRLPSSHGHSKVRHCGARLVIGLPIGGHGIRLVLASLPFPNHLGARFSVHREHSRAAMGELFLRFGGLV
jgi:hypothetical protein